MKIINFLLNLLLAVQVSTASPLALVQPLPQTALAENNIYSAILCEKDGDFYDILSNEKECRDAVVFGHSLCYEGVAEDVVDQINTGFYYFNGFANLSDGRTYNQDSILFRLSNRHTFKEVLLPSCNFYSDYL